MLFSLDVVRARKGDCFMLHYGDAADPHLMIVDGGPSDVYARHLRPRLAQIREARRLAKEAPLPIDIVNVSHIDDDHIRGILELTRELRKAKNERKPPLVRVENLWHNAFEELVGSEPADLAAPVQFGAAALAAEVAIPGSPSVDAAKVLSSIPQGYQLREDAKFLQWRVNAAFGEDVIMARKQPNTIALSKEVKVIVIGPMKSELQELRKQHQKWLAGRKQVNDADSSLAAYLDRSVTNLSSIVLLVEAGGKRMLLTGDARGDKILAGLEVAKIIAKGGRLYVDLLKVPHHGSSNDVEREFFERVTADHYVFSGNGEHGNPERETLEMLLAARLPASFVLHFTYPIAEIDAGREAEWRKQQGREQQLRDRQGAGKRKRGTDGVIVRPDWSPHMHGLVALFAQSGLPNQNQRVVCLDGHLPHVIDLLDECKFGAVA
jgi:beta-lactamase superfamily II metal-dependent hydrolase